MNDFLTFPRFRAFLLCYWILLAAASAPGKDTDPEVSELKKFSLEELMNMEITSASRGPERLFDTPAAISVITSEDLQRSGVICIAEALRQVPGVEVARLNAHDWAISVRGFHSAFPNKLLVMMDSRTVYSPLFSGTFWDVQDAILEDIDRIEVIRGPGATLWGANAVNGVINVITKSAKDTQGLLVSGGVGTEERLFGNVRYGVSLKEDTYFRVYAKYFQVDDSVLPDGREAADAWEKFQGGMRFDWLPSDDQNRLTFQGDIYSGKEDQTYTIPILLPPFTTVVQNMDRGSGGNVLGQWTRNFSEDSQLIVRAYYDKTVRDSAVFRYELDTEDIDVQQRFQLGERNKITAGGGFRRMSDNARNSLNVTVLPPRRTTYLYSSFIQDEITLLPEKWFLTLGSKFEHNDFTGFEIQPSVRLLWTPKEDYTVWAAVSRAVRTPSRVEDGVILNAAGPPPGTATLFGNPNFDSENMIAYEIGYRIQLWKKATFDLATYYNDYDDVVSTTPLAPGLNSTTQFRNDQKAETYGAELAATIQITEDWRIYSAYTYIQMQLHQKSALFPMSSEAGEKNNPHHQFYLRSSIDFGRQFDFGREFQFDATFRYVDNLVVAGILAPSYSTIDLRLGWRPSKNWEIALVGQNLLDDRHPEFYPAPIATRRTEVERSFYGKITWRF